jgi:hypothetical protein
MFLVYACKSKLKPKPNPDTKDNDAMWEGYLRMWKEKLNLNIQVPLSAANGDVANGHISPFQGLSGASVSVTSS